MNGIGDRCLACYEPIDQCQGGHGEICEDCDGFADGPHRSFCPVVRGLSWVHVHSATEDESGVLHEWFNSDEFGVLQYLAGFDDGNETDEGGTYTPPDESLRRGLPPLTEHQQECPWGEYDMVVELLDYVLVRDCQRDSLSLYRRELP